MTKDDIICEEDILGPNLGSLKGKMTCKTPSRVLRNTFNKFPDRILEWHDNMTLHYVYKKNN